MTERMMYQPTAKQAREWASIPEPALPSDDEIRAVAKGMRGGKMPWGIVKRDMILANYRISPEYQRGLWQGRVDAARGLDYSEERNDSSYNVGYYTGYTEFHSNVRGWDRATQQRFRDTYMSDLEA